jgi:hypothetical protein
MFSFVLKFLKWFSKRIIKVPQLAALLMQEVSENSSKLLNSLRK